MNEKIKEFLQKAAGDEALAAKLKACKSPDEAYALASGASIEEIASLAASGATSALVASAAAYAAAI